MSGFVDVPSDDGRTFQAWLEDPPAPDGARHGSVVLLAEGYNVNHWARAAARRYAEAGYRVLAPDLYWRQQPGVYLEYTEASQRTCRALYGQMDFDAAVRDSVACMNHLRAVPTSNGRVALVGFCLGGKIAFLTAARANPDAAVGYYSIDLEPYFDEVPRIACPAAFHFGALDTRVPVRFADDIRQRTRPGQALDVVVHDKAGHGFGRFGQPPFEPESAARAHDHTLALLAHTLEPR